MKKYLAKIVYKIVIRQSAEVEQFDEQLCLIEARDFQEAFIKARLMGVKNEDKTEHDSESKVYWKFVDVPYLKVIESMEDGEELYSCIHEKDKEDHYERFVKKRATELQLSIQQPLVIA